MTKLECFEKHLTFRHFVERAFNMYLTTGIKMVQWDENDQWTKNHKILMVGTFLNMSVNFCCKVGYAFLNEFDDTVHLTQWLMYLVFATNATFKMFSVALGHVTLRRVVKELDLLFPSTHKERQAFKVTEGYNQLKRHSDIMFYSHWIISLMFMIFPVVQSSIQYLLSGVFVPRYPYIVAHPFEGSTGLPYMLIYVSQFYAGFAASCYFLGSDMLLMSIVYVLILQFQYLGLRIANFDPKDFEQDIRELKDILEKHYLLHDLAERINNIFRMSILMNYLISILVIVLLGIQIVSGSDYLDFLKFIGFFAASLVQVFYVCRFGTQLMERSAEVGETFMGQKWYMTDNRYQRMVTLAILRSQRPAVLTAYKFFPISMESFSNLMSSSYQFFTLLRANMENEID